MDVKQIYKLTNDAVGEVLGKTDLLQEDLSNLVDVGTEIFNANAKDKYVEALVNRIGKTIFVSRSYKGIYPNILMDGSEYGSVIQKIQGEWPDASENETWELQDGASYNQDTFYQPKVSEKFFNSKVTFEVAVSITDEQVKQSFTSPTELGTFISMILINVENAMTLRVDLLAQRTINNFIGETIYNEYESAGLDTKSGTRAINLLKLYNDKFETTLTADKCLYDIDFLKFASFMIRRTIKHLQSASALFNMGGKTRFTPRDRINAYLLNDFFDMSSVYLQADTYHNDLVALPNFETIPFFQGSGDNFDFEDISKIQITTSGGHAVTATGILGVVFDRYALGIYNYNRRVTTHYNAKAEFYNDWYKMDASYFNDFNENFIVFFVA